MKKIKKSKAAVKSPAASTAGVDVMNEQSFVRVGAGRIKKLIATVLKGERAGKKGVSVLLTDDRRIRRYHKVYMGIDTATDAIAFSADDPGYLGDVIVSAETALRRAPEFGVTAANELERYAVHGVLHLLGYRDKKPNDHKRMHARQEKYLGRGR